ncbi:hypothetical protein BC938DRAFT_481447 [Jimgerdemannia flammicorona]|uniref:FAD dependent oxidoreductase domain-containing protein n=1 Tax=Jimgerdemannia flammicorona TaxID=994334 RepID=A0A433QG53_9FUNG|nr:hypothetical protein BC938DRAFT_481447 [Jimgerdemannia flammicorona]
MNLLSSPLNRSSRKFLGIWTYDFESTTLTPPPFPPKITPLYAPLVLRGLTFMMPAIAEYAQPSTPTGKHPLDIHTTNTSVVAGYYCKTSRNLPIIGPIQRLDTTGGAVSGLFVCAAFSGFGVMNGPGMAEVLAGYVEGWMKGAEIEAPCVATDRFISTTTSNLLLLLSSTYQFASRSISPTLHFITLHFRRAERFNHSVTALRAERDNSVRYALVVCLTFTERTLEVSFPAVS